MSPSRIPWAERLGLIGRGSTFAKAMADAVQPRPYTKTKQCYTNYFTS